MHKTVPPAGSCSFTVGGNSLGWAYWSLGHFRQNFTFVFFMDNVNELFCHYSRTRTCLHRSALRHIMWSVLRECSAVHPNLPPSQYQQEPNYNLTGPCRETLIAIYSFFLLFFLFTPGLMSVSLLPSMLTNLSNSRNYSNFFCLSAD